MKTDLLLPYLDEIQKVAYQLYIRGWAEINAGNFTIRIPDFPKSLLSSFSTKKIKLETKFPMLEGQVFLTKEKGIRFRELALDPTKGSGLIVITDQGTSYRYCSLDNNQSCFCPTSELLSHLLLQEYLITQKPILQTILHTHPLELIIFSHLMKHKTEAELNSILLSMHVEIPLFLPEGIGFVSYQEPGSLDLAKASLEALKKYSILIWERHGSLAVGTTLLDAYETIDLVNKAASIYKGLGCLGLKGG